MKLNYLVHEINVGIESNYNIVNIMKYVEIVTYFKTCYAPFNVIPMKELWEEYQ